MNTTPTRAIVLPFVTAIFTAAVVVTTASAPALAQSTCANATPLCPGGVCGNQAPFVGSNLNTGNTGATGNPPGFHSITATDSAPGVFYTFSSASDQQLTISTCLQNQSPPNGEPDHTNFNTLLTVFCGGCGSLKTVGDNDDAPQTECALNTFDPNTSIGASVLSFPAKSDTQYTLYVTGANGDTLHQGYFWLSITASAFGPINPPVTCASILDPPCPFSQPGVPGPNDVFEQQFCGSGLPDNNDDPCAAPPNDTKTINPGKTAWGTVETPSQGTAFGTDWWRLSPDAVAPPEDIGQTQSIYRITFTSEAPLTVDVFTSACPFPGGLLGTSVLFTPCNQEFFDVAALDSGPVWLRVRTTSVSGLPCPGRNHYKFKLESISPGEFGACCRGVFPSCYLTTREACTDSASPDGSPGIVGVFAGVGVACAPNQTTPCDDLVNIDTVYGDGPIGATLDPVGSCCQQTGTCTVTSQAGCPNTGAGGAVWTVKFTRPTACPNDGGPPCPYAFGTNVLTVCTPFPCNSLNYQRCCFVDGSCRFVGPVLCSQLGGVASAGTCLPLTTCENHGGACCRGQSVCTIELLSSCTGTNSGQYKGDFTTCSPTNPCTGLCCAGAVCAANVLFPNCNAIIPGKIKFTLGSAAACPTYTPPVSTAYLQTPCCRANFNHTGLVTPQDLFDFLTAYFAANPAANTNGGGLSPQDLFDYLKAYFSPQCS